MADLGQKKGVSRKMSDSGEVFANLPAIVHFFSLARERATASGGRSVGTWGFKIYPHKYHPPRCQGTVFPIRTLTLAQKTF